MGLPLTNNVEFFKLIKYDPSQESEREGDFIEIAVRLKNSEFSMKNIENLILQNEKFQDQNEKMKEAMNSYNSIVASGNIRDSIGGTTSSLEQQTPEYLKENGRLKK
uniref:Uncharacterized protein n=1 Tax=Euplotes harpa TaxID=151035 RepID=A0A7S3J724_9SPIT|mmetsp:Transcript_20863/g.24096  ORF Transcript_20863/g.24096 Transcript_20863/m.24096 type:complete len:107 (+) Transcript_20863:2-322(+)